jgi:hypothetical protein
VGEETRGDRGEEIGGERQEERKEKSEYQK